jgi:AcrR family transcriptional regulator
MVQVKKAAVEQAIQDAALVLFSKFGFRGTKLSSIAEAAGVGVGNIYSYFPSKTHLLYSLYRPWFLDRLDAIKTAAGQESDPHDRVKTILLGLWRDTPAANPMLANALMEALATDTPGGGKKDPLLVDAEDRISAMLRDALPAARHGLLADDLIANLCLLAYDGFVINRHLGDMRDIDRMADLFAAMLLGAPAAEAKGAIHPIKSAKTA